MIDHCVSAFRKEQEEKAYRIYVTDSLKTIVENTARFAGGKEMSVRYADLIEPKPQKEDPNDTMTCEEIVDGIWSRMRRR